MGSRWWLLRGTAAVGERSGGACGAGRACHPTFEDLLQELESFPRHRGVSANSTCGREPERYRRGEEQTETCDASRPDLRHPSLALAHSYPDLGSWWQSERGVSPVHVQLSLTHRFLFARTELAFVSQRPDSLVLEASADQGHSWKVWQYLAHDCSVCVCGCVCVWVCGWGSQADALCLLTVQVFYNAAARLGGAYLRNETLYRHFIFTDLRITFTGFGGRAAELQDYYAVADWSVTGQCACFGHSHTCSGQVSYPLHPTRSECECEHGTTGAHCQHCLPLLNQQPWAMGGSCVTDCGCAGRALSCYFDAVKGFGVCENCSENTTGEKCHLCRPSYYTLLQEFQDPFGICPCDCEPSGSAGWCDRQSGTCPCLRNVAGPKCSGCRSASFWGFHSSQFLGCQPCACHQPGSASSACHPVSTWRVSFGGEAEVSGVLWFQVTGQCECLAHTVGQHCEDCEDGFYWDSLQRCTGMSPTSAPLHNAEKPNPPTTSPPPPPHQSHTHTYIHSHSLTHTYTQIQTHIHTHTQIYTDTHIDGHIQT
uniref:Laminin N-terminal domain-containing protein n=1 Tax=Callorhinchus milii TaxID=7868 RepID=A0A4W3J123_CALMI